MNDKRFYKTNSSIEDYRIYDEDKEDAYFISCDDEHTVDCLVELLNELNETNKRFIDRRVFTPYKNEIKKLKEVIKDLVKSNAKIREENKELKQQMNRLYNYFMDWHSDEMGGNQFSEMWDIVKESESWDDPW